MEIDKNQQGQTIVRLSHSEWQQYGEQAGFLEKDAIAVERGTLDGMTDEQEQKAQQHLESLRSRIQELTNELMEATQAFAESKITYFEDKGIFEESDILEEEPEEELEQYEEQDLEGDICLMTYDALTQASSININQKTDNSQNLNSAQEQTGILPPFDKTARAV